MCATPHGLVDAQRWQLHTVHGMQCRIAATHGLCCTATASADSTAGAATAAIQRAQPAVPYNSVHAVCRLIQSAKGLRRKQSPGD
jgi:hypothetical protein